MAFDALVELKDTQHEEMMGRELAKGGDFPELGFVGLGSKVWEIGCVYESVELVRDEESGQEREEMVLKRRLRRVGFEDVREVEIWRMDSLDVI